MFVLVIKLSIHTPSDKISLSFYTSVCLCHNMDLKLPLNKMIDLSPDPVCIVDTHGRFIFISATCERLLGYRQDELIGRNMIELVHPDDRARTLESAENIMEGRDLLSFENRYIRKDGRIIDILWSARWLEDEQVRLAVGHDITELKHSQRIQHALYQISEAAHRADSLATLCAQIHEIIHRLIPAANFFVALYEGEDNTIAFPYFVDEQQKNPEEIPLLPGTFIAEIINNGRALLVSPGKRGLLVASPELDYPEHTQWLGVPLVSQKGILGALVVQNYSDNLRYTHEDKDLLQFVSTQISDAIERKRTEVLLQHLASHDALTDLPNRALFHDRFDMALKRARRDNEGLALLYIDLDNFKQVNDTYGHKTGDGLLKELSRRLQRCVRETDTISRRGGDEFTVLLSNFRGENVTDNIIEKIHAAISVPYKLGDKTLQVSASIGTAIYPDHGIDMEQLFDHADKNMYAVKNQAG